MPEEQGQVGKSPLVCPRFRFGAGVSSCLEVVMDVLTSLTELSSGLLEGLVGVVFRSKTSVVVTSIVVTIFMFWALAWGMAKEAREERRLERRRRKRELRKW